MNVFRSILASFVALALLAVAVPAAQADVAVQPPVCQHIVTGPDVYFGVCTDPIAECGVWTYNHRGETCHAPGAGVVPRAHCQQLFVGPDIDSGVCYDLDGEDVGGTDCLVWTYDNFGEDVCYVPQPQGSTAAVPRAHCEQLLVGPDIDQGICYDLDGEYVAGMNCVVWWYSTYSTGQDRCYVPYPPGAVAAYHAPPIFCVGDEGPELPGVCYDPDDYDGCDVYAGLGGGNQVCVVPALGTCPSSTPEWPGVCWTPRQECQLWIGLGHVYCLYPVSASTDASADAAPPRAYCQQVLVGPDIDQGVCYDLDGEYVAGMNCVVWWYSTYSTGQNRCYVPYPPGAVAVSNAHPTCVGDETAGACYDPDDGDRCDAYVLFHHGNHVCIVPDLDPRTAGTSTGAAAPPRAHCERILYGPDIDQGLCYDLDGEEVNGRECLVWWYAKYGTGTTVCYVPQPVTSTIDETCYHVADNPHARSVCHDLSRDTCQVWTETSSGDRCLT